MTAGHPRKFQTPLELQTLVDSYFAKCDPHMEEVTEWVQARTKKGELRKDKYGMNYLVEATHKIMTEKQPYGIVALAVHCGTTRETLSVYEDGEYDTDEAKYSDIIKMAKARVEADLEQDTRSGRNPVGSIFNLKANFKWKDQSNEPELPPHNPVRFVNHVSTEPEEPFQDATTTPVHAPSSSTQVPTAAGL